MDKQMHTIAEAYTASCTRFARH